MGDINEESLHPFVMGGKRHNVVHVALFVLVTPRWQLVQPVRSSTRPPYTHSPQQGDNLYLDKEAEMACETPLEGDKVRVDT